MALTRRRNDSEEPDMVQMITCNLAVLAIAGIYYAWRDRHAKQFEKRAVLRDRVAYMLWVAAQRA